MPTVRFTEQRAEAVSREDLVSVTRARRLQRVKAIVERQRYSTAECDDRSLLNVGVNR